MRKANPPKKQDNRGSTLAEMIVTFALIGIFMTAAVGVIGSAVITHTEITAAMYAQTVSETLMDKITGELAAAQANHEPAVVIDEFGEEIAFYNRNGEAVVCSVEDGLLVFRYGEGHPPWQLEEKAYMGFRITGMQIERPEDKNILEIHLQIKNLKTDFEYAVSRCTACYNFKNAADWEKIGEGEPEIFIGGE